MPVYAGKALLFELIGRLNAGKVRQAIQFLQELVQVDEVIDS